MPEIASKILIFNTFNNEALRCALKPMAPNVSAPFSRKAIVMKASRDRVELPSPKKSRTLNNPEVSPD